MENKTSVHLTKHESYEENDYDVSHLNKNKKKRLQLCWKRCAVDSKETTGKLVPSSVSQSNLDKCVDGAKATSCDKNQDKNVWSPLIPFITPPQWIYCKILIHLRLLLHFANSHLTWLVLTIIGPFSTWYLWSINHICLQYQFTRNSPAFGVFIVKSHTNVNIY